MVAVVITLEELEDSATHRTARDQEDRAMDRLMEMAEVEAVAVTTTTTTTTATEMAGAMVVRGRRGLHQSLTRSRSSFG